MKETKEAMGEVTTLYKFFGPRPGAAGLKDFVEECKALSAIERSELARLAAHEMGLTQGDVKFPLTA